MSKKKQGAASSSNNPFEDAIKKIVNTPANPALLIEGAGIEYSISNVNGKAVQFTQILIKNREVNHFRIKAQITMPEGEPSPLPDYIHLKLDPYQKRNDTVLIAKPPIEVPKSAIKFSISIEPLTDDDFETGIVYYKILG